MKLKTDLPGRTSFSIIVPVRNMSDTIVRTLESIINQDYPDYEIIVIDGCSTDDTMDRLSDYANQIAHLVSETDSGVYDAINKGISLTCGSVVGILNGDDYYSHSQVLSLYAEKFDEPHVGIVYGDLEFFPRNDPSKTIRSYSSENFNPRKLRFGWMPPHPTVFVRSEVYRKVGPYRTDYRISADYEFLIRAMITHAIPYDRIDSVVIRMQYGGLSTSGLRASFRLNKEIIRACRDNNLETNWLFIMSKIPAKLWEFFPWKARR